MSRSADSGRKTERFLGETQPEKSNKFILRTPARKSALPTFQGKLFTSLQELGEYQYDAHIREFNGFIRTECRSVSIRSISRYVDALLKQRRAFATIRKKIAAVKKALIREMIEVDPSLSFLAALNYRFKTELPRIPASDRVHVDRYPSRAEVERLVAKAEPKAALIIAAKSSSGARVSELRMLDLRSMSVRRGVCTFRVTGKGSVDHPIHLEHKVVRRIIRAYGSTTYLFPNRRGLPLSRQYMGKIVRRACRKVLGKTYNLHAFRHFAATRIISETGDCTLAAEWLSHKSVSTTLALYNHPRINPAKILKITSIRRDR